MKSGIINVYKEAGFTSFDVVAKMRGILHIKKIGHTGTLDPDAVGVLPVCVGKATKVCDLLTEKDKTYEAVMRLGIVTDTQDMTGTILEEKDPVVEEEKIRQVVESFVGEISQVPPMYSALKVNGQKLCDLARKGIVVERKPRKISIYNIEIKEIHLPYVTMVVHCSKGTYIRTLCHDIGQRLGCGACMEHLVRTQVAMFAIENAYKLREIQQMADQGILDHILTPIDELFPTYPKVIAKEIADKKITNGGAVSFEEIKSDMDTQEDGQRVRLYLSEGRFAGIYYRKGHLLVLEKMFLESE